MPVRELYADLEVTRAELVRVATGSDGSVRTTKRPFRYLSNIAGGTEPRYHPTYKPTLHCLASAEARDEAVQMWLDFGWWVLPFDWPDEPTPDQWRIDPDALIASAARKRRHMATLGWVVDDSRWPRGNTTRRWWRAIKEGEVQIWEPAAKRLLREREY